MIDIVIDNTYEFLLHQTLLGQNIMNRFSYVCTAKDVDELSAATLLNAWWAHIDDEIAAVQHDGVEYVKAGVYHLGGNEGTFEKALTGTGSLALATYTAAPSNACYSIRLFTTEGISRSGWKRFGGLIQNHLDGNTLDLSASPTLTTAMTNLRAKFTTIFYPTAGIQFKPAVVRQLTAGPPPTYAGYPILSTNTPFLGSQNTRKPTYGD